MTPLEATMRPFVRETPRGKYHVTTSPPTSAAMVDST